MKLMRIGVDLAKNVFQIHGVDRHEQPIWRQRLPRDRWLQTVLDKIEPGCEIGMESWSGAHHWAHHWARQLQARGFQVRLIAPQFVKRPVVHSDRDVHYRWPGWLSRIADAKLIRSMSRKGCSPDNAACEGFFGG